jgi:hypothetical protein
MKLALYNNQNNNLYNKPAKNTDKNVSFTNSAIISSVFNAATKTMQYCDTNPIAGVSLIDVTSMIAPRTYIDTKSNGFAGLETLRRESSGLLINCLLPGFAVLGIAGALKTVTMGKEFSNIKGVKLHKLWADENTINMTKHAWTSATENGWTAGKPTPEHVEKYVRNIVGNVVNLGKHAESENVIKTLSNAIQDSSTNQKALLKQLDKFASETIEKTKIPKHLNFEETFETAVSQGAKSKAKLSSNIHELFRDVVNMGKTYSNEVINKDNIGNFAERLTKLVKQKSFAGVALICAVGFGVQKYNRYLTEKKSGHKGFPGYKDYGKENTHLLTEKEKAKLSFNKALATAGMIGLTALSMKGFNLKKLQFKSILPSMDQSRFIAATTFVGRMLAADDNNELRETTLRDSLGFASLYFLGDYVAKAVASAVPDKNLLNITAKVPEKVGEGVMASVNHAWKKTVHWVNNIELKSFEEVASNSKNWRTAAQLSGILYSCLALGFAVPTINRKMTEANRKKQLETMKHNENIPQQIPVMTSRANMSEKTKKLFSAFINPNY